MAQKQPIYDIGTYKSSSLNKDTQLNVHASNKRFRIDLFTSNFESSPVLLVEYLRHVRRQEPEWTPDDFEEAEDPLVEMHEWILQPFLPIFCALAPLDPSQKYTVEDCFFAEELRYIVKVMGDNLVPVYLSSTKNMRNHHMGACLPSSVDYSSFAVYHPREVQVKPVQIQPHCQQYPAKYLFMGKNSLASSSSFIGVMLILLQERFSHIQRFKWLNLIPQVLHHNWKG